MIFVLLLVGYLAGVFRTTMYETVHFLCHLVQGTEIGLHSYTTHLSNHEHLTLDFIFDDLGEKPLDKNVVAKTELKKKIEFSKPVLMSDISFQNEIENFFSYKFCATENVSEVPHAPPRFL